MKGGPEKSVTSCVSQSFGPHYSDYLLHNFNLFSGFRILQKEYEQSKTFEKYGAKPLRKVHPSCKHLPADSGKSMVHEQGPLCDLSPYALI